MLERLTPYVPWLALLVATTALFADANELRSFVKENADVFPAWFLVGSGWVFIATVLGVLAYWALVVPIWQGQLLLFVVLAMFGGLFWALVQSTPESYSIWPGFLRIRLSLIPEQILGCIGLFVALMFAGASERNRRFPP